MVGENTNDQKNDANDEYAAPASRMMRFTNWLYSLLVDDFVFGLLSVLSLVISFVAYSRTESPYSFGFLSVPVGILIFRLSIALVGAAALRKEKVVPEVLRKSGLARCRVGFSRLSAWCHRVGTCSGSGGSTNRWR